MHVALSIDEIIHEVFSYDLDRRSLAQAAQTCKTWKDPALDHLWRFLPSVVPLILLIQGVSLEDKQFVLEQDTKLDKQLLCYYSSKVRNISRRPIPVIPTAIITALTSIWSNCDNVVFPNLRCARLSTLTTRPQSTPLFISSTLQELDLDLRTYSVRSADMYCDYIDSVSKMCRLRKLSIRGEITDRVRTALSYMPYLRRLLLRTRSSLSHIDLWSMALLPELEDLDIVAGSFSANDFQLARPSFDAPTFPSLRTLHFSSTPDMIECLLGLLPIDQVHELHLESLAPESHSWKNIFKAVSNCASKSLLELTIEHHIDLHEIDINQNPGGSSSSLEINPRPSRGSLEIISIASLKQISSLKNMQRLSFEVTIPPTLSDYDVGAIVKWWPNLTYLDLGHPVEELASSYISLASLTILGLQLKQLRTLILPLDFSGELRLHGLQSSCSSLHTLVITTPPLTPNEVYLRKVASYVSTLFPSLRRIEGGSETGDESWNALTLTS